MPIVIPDGLVDQDVLREEKIFAYSQDRALSQDIRPLEIAIVNLMPKKEETEIQLFRMLSNTPLQINTDLIHMQSHKAKNSDPKRLSRFYKTFDDIKNKKYDGIIVTGAPIEKLNYKDIVYWEELKKVFEFAKSNVYSTLFICWGAQAALYYYFGIDAAVLDKKIFGVYEFEKLGEDLLFKGFDDTFFAPQSRYSRVEFEQFKDKKDLIVLAGRRETGVVLAATKNHRQIFSFSHFEYDKNTLHDEYIRDKSKGLDTLPAENYYENDDPNGRIKVRWRANGQLLFLNWLNYCVYQSTPYDLGELVGI